MTTSRHLPIAALAVAAVFLLKLAALVQFRKYPLLQADSGPDAVIYAALARQLLDGNVDLGPGLYYFPPLYVYFAALALWLGKSLFSLRLIQIGLGTLAVVLVFRTAKLWHGRRAAWFAGALAALTGVFTFYEALFLPAAILPFISALAMYRLAVAVSREEARQKAKPAVLAGLALGLLALSHPPSLLASSGLVVILLVARRWRTASILAAGLALTLLPLIIRNYVVARDLTPLSSHGGLSFYIGNNAGADGTHREVDGIAPSILGQRDDSRRVAERAIGRSLDDGDVSAHFYGLAWKWVTASPGDALRLYGRKLALVFNAGEPAPSYSYAHYRHGEHNVLRYLPVGAWLLVPLGVLGLWLGSPGEPSARRAFWLWSSYVPLLALSIAAFFVSSRQRLPLLVPLCITSGAVLDLLASRARGLRTRPRRTVIAAAAVGAILAVTANWPMRRDDGRAEERTRIALWLIGQQRYDEASVRVAALEKEHPNPGMMHFRIGRALLARQQTDAAVRHLERSRTLGLNDPELDLTLGQALVAARRPRDAIVPLRRAVDARVRPGVAGMELARAHAASGDRSSALRILQNVRPDRADDGESWRRLGELAMELQVPRLAEAFLRQSLRVTPNSAATLEQLGLAIALSGRFEEAVRAFEEAVRIDGADASARLNLAVALAEVGRVAEARRQAEEALRLDPSYAKARQFLGAIEQKGR